MKNLARRSAIALALVVPVPTLGIASVVYFWPGPLGRVLFSTAKVYLLLFPLIWHLFVEKERVSFSPLRKGGGSTGLVVGLGMAGIILAVYSAVGPIDPAAIRSRVIDMGIDTRGAFLGAAASWIFVNSVMEEYVFRWFITSRCRYLFGPRVPAAVLSAVFFTIHHTVALASFLKPGLVVLASLGVFSAGWIWSVMYEKYQSIWPGWIAHALADVAVFSLGWHMLFLSG